MLIEIADHYNINLVLENIQTLYLIAFLPPAANIIVLETYYLQSGRSASLIASGTVFSLIAISSYIGVILYF